jgi:hypothetical protein
MNVAGGLAADDQAPGLAAWWRLAADILLMHCSEQEQSVVEYLPPIESWAMQPIQLGDMLPPTLAAYADSALA